jgi:hypothetical protein
MRAFQIGYVQYLCLTVVNRTVPIIVFQLVIRGERKEAALSAEMPPISRCA